MDEVALAVPNITYVLVVPWVVWSRVGSSGFLGETFLLWGFHGLGGIFAWGLWCGGLMLMFLIGFWGGFGVVFIGESGYGD